MGDLLRIWLVYPAAVGLLYAGLFILLASLAGSIRKEETVVRRGYFAGFVIASYFYFALIGILLREIFKDLGSYISEQDEAEPMLLVVAFVGVVLLIMARFQYIVPVQLRARVEKFGKFQLGDINPLDANTIAAVAVVGWAFAFVSAIFDNPIAANAVTLWIQEQFVFLATLPHGGVLVPIAAVIAGLCMYLYLDRAFISGWIDRAMEAAKKDE